MRHGQDGTTPPRKDRWAKQANPLGVIGLDLLLTTLVLVVLLDTGLPLVATLGAAWIGGAVATVASLVALDLIDPACGDCVDTVHPWGQGPGRG